MHRIAIGAVALLMAGALAPAAFAASGFSGLGDSSPENGTVAVTGGSMRDPGDVWVPSAQARGSAQGGYLGNNPAADDGSASRAPRGVQGGYLGKTPGSAPTAGK